MKESIHIKKLEKIVPKLNDFVSINSPNVEYNLEKGTAIGFNVYNIPEIAVQRVFMSKGSIFPLHTHKENEYVLIYKGCIKVHIKSGVIHANVGGKSTQDKDMILKVADGFFVPPETPHSGEALEDTWMMSTTIPAGCGYPNDK